MWTLWKGRFCRKKSKVVDYKSIKLIVSRTLYTILTINYAYIWVICSFNQQICTEVVLHLFVNPKFLLIYSFEKEYFEHN